MPQTVRRRLLAEPLRQGALTSLLSAFEVLISELIQLYYSKFPGRLPAKQALTLEVLRELDSAKVEDIEKYIASAEIDSLLYKSLRDQLVYFEGLNVGLQPLNPELAQLTEVTQRRNLFVHNQGIVNRPYLTRVNDDILDEYEIELGKQLVITGRYLNDAIDTVFASGLVLAQLCWRTWDKGSTEIADGFVVDPVLYDALREERFEVARRIADRLSGARFASEHSRRRMIVNHAIALKELGFTEKMESILGTMNWSACSIEYPLALHALRNEEEAFYNLLPRVVRAEAIERWHLEDWPVYAHLRGTEQFNQAIEEYFPKKSDGANGEDD